MKLIEEGESSAYFDDINGMEGNMDRDQVSSNSGYVNDNVQSRKSMSSFQFLNGMQKTFQEFKNNAFSAPKSFLEYPSYLGGTEGNKSFSNQLNHTSEPFNGRAHPYTQSHAPPQNLGYVPSHAPLHPYAHLPSTIPPKTQVTHKSSEAPHHHPSPTGPIPSTAPATGASTAVGPGDLKIVAGVTKSTQVKTGDEKK